MLPPPSEHREYPPGLSLRKWHSSECPWSVPVGQSVCYEKSSLRMLFCVCRSCFQSSYDRCKTSAMPFSLNFLFFFFQYWRLSPGPTHARQASTPLRSHTPSPFSLSLCFETVLLSCPRWPWTCGSQVARVTALCQLLCLIFLDVPFPLLGPFPFDSSTVPSWPHCSSMLRERDHDYGLILKHYPAHDIYLLWATFFLRAKFSF